MREDALDGGSVEGNGAALLVTPIELGDNAAARELHAARAIERGEAVVLAGIDDERASPSAVEPGTSVGADNEAAPVGLEGEGRADFIARRDRAPAIGSGGGFGAPGGWRAAREGGEGQAKRRRGEKGSAAGVSVGHGHSRLRGVRLVASAAQSPSGQPES
jgi:hypothetical protein